MIGQDGITTHGDLHRGYAVHTPDAPPGEGPGFAPIVPMPPVTQTGACCNSGDCSIDTQSHCESGGGNYLGNGTPCDGVDCTQGACCDSDDFSCFLDTSECEGYGPPFSYLGDGTVCDPNPCGSPCGCGWLHNGVWYLTKEVHLVGSLDCTDSGEEHSSTDITTSATYSQPGCVLTTFCSGGSDTHNCPEFGDVHFGWVSCAFDGGCGWSHGTCITNDTFYCTHCGTSHSGGCPGGVLIDQTDDCHSHEDNGICTIDITVTVTYSNPCV
jgi:hypothetical protein